MKVRNLALGLVTSVSFSACAVLTPTSEEKATDKPVAASQNVISKYVVYPTPQEMVMKNELVNLPTKENLNIVLGEGVLDVTQKRVERIFAKFGITLTAANFSDSKVDGKFNILLGINGTKGDIATSEAAKLGIDLKSLFAHRNKGKNLTADQIKHDNKYDIHLFDLSDNQITIVGEHNDAVYYGLATMNLIFEQKTADNMLQAVTIEDYAYTLQRGSIEGFYYLPWSKQDILSQAEYMERYKMNTFTYGPKGDAYHLSKWREPYPASTTAEEKEKGIFSAGDMAEFAQVYAKHNVDFMWTIHPSQSSNGIQVAYRNEWFHKDDKGEFGWKNSGMPKGSKTDSQGYILDKKGNRIKTKISGRKPEFYKRGDNVPNLNYGQYGEYTYQIDAQGFVLDQIGQRVAKPNSVKYTPQNQAYMDKGIEDIMKKVHQMYKLGFRDFGLFVDDINGHEAAAGATNQAYMADQFQKELENTYKSKEEDPVNGVGPSMYVPTNYYIGWKYNAEHEKKLSPLRDAKLPLKRGGNIENLRVEGVKGVEYNSYKGAHENLVVTFTGHGCWGNIAEIPFKVMNERYIGRTSAMWWNFPVNDYTFADTMFMGIPTTKHKMDTDVRSTQGIMTNPMNQFEASKVVLFAIADYAWNIPAFDPVQNWKDSFASYTSDKQLQKALMIFGENGARETRDVTAKNKDLINKFNKAKSTAEKVKIAAELLVEMKEIIWACDKIMSHVNDKDYKIANLVDEIESWVLTLRAMAQKTAVYLEGMKRGKTKEAIKRMLNEANTMAIPVIYSDAAYTARGGRRKPAAPSMKLLKPFANDTAKAYLETLLKKK